MLMKALQMLIIDEIICRFGDDNCEELGALVLSEWS